MPPLSPDRQLSWTAVSIGSAKALRVGTSSMPFSILRAKTDRLYNWLRHEDTNLITTRWMLEFLNARGGGGGGAAAPNIGIEEVQAVRAEGHEHTAACDPCCTQRRKGH